MAHGTNRCLLRLLPRLVALALGITLAGCSEDGDGGPVVRGPAQPTGNANADKQRTVLDVDGKPVPFVMLEPKVVKEWVLPENVVYESVVSVRDLSRWSCLVRKDAKVMVYDHPNLSEPYDDVVPILYKLRAERNEKSPLSLINDGRDLIYAARTGEHIRIVVNGEAGKAYDGLGRISPVVSPDGKSIAYAAKSGDKWLVVVNGVEGPLFDEIDEMLLQFSPDSNHLGYAGRRGDRWVVVVDGKEGAAYLKIRHHSYESKQRGLPLFSPDSARFGYVGVIDEKSAAVVINHEEQDAYRAAASLLLGPKGRTAFVAHDASGNRCVVIDGDRRELNREQRIDSPSSLMQFSPDGRMCVYVMEQGSKKFVHVNDQPWVNTLRDAHHVQIIPPRNRVFVGGIDERNYNKYLLDDEILDGFWGMETHDSGRLAWLKKRVDETLRLEKYSYVIDGQQQPEYDRAYKFQFSEDGKRFCYMAVVGDKTRMVVDGNEAKPYARVRDFLFGVDPRHDAYVGCLGPDGNNPVLVIDGQERVRMSMTSWIGTGGVLRSPDGLRFAVKSWTNNGTRRELALLIVSREGPVQVVPGEISAAWWEGDDAIGYTLVNRADKDQRKMSIYRVAVKEP